MRDLLIETQTGEPAPRQVHAQLLNQLPFAGDAVQIADQHRRIELCEAGPHESSFFRSSILNARFHLADPVLEKVCVSLVAGVQCL